MVVLLHEVVDDAADDPEPQTSGLEDRGVPEPAGPLRGRVLLVVPAPRPQGGGVTALLHYIYMSLCATFITESDIYIGLSTT